MRGVKQVSFRLLKCPKASKYCRDYPGEIPETTISP